MVPAARVPGQPQGTNATPASWANSSAGRQAAGFTGPTRPETRVSAEDTAPSEPGVRHGSGSSATSKRGPPSRAASRFRRAAARRAARSGRARAKMGSQAQGPSTPTLKTAERAERGRSSSSSSSRSPSRGRVRGRPGGDGAHHAGAQSRGSRSPPSRRAQAVIAGLWEHKRSRRSGCDPQSSLRGLRNPQLLKSIDPRLVSASTTPSAGLDDCMGSGAWPGSTPLIHPLRSASFVCPSPPLRAVGGQWGHSRTLPWSVSGIRDLESVWRGLCHSPESPGLGPRAGVRGHRADPSDALPQVSFARAWGGGVGTAGQSP